MKLLIVDDHILFREGLRSLFDNQPDFEVVGEAGSVKEAIGKAGAVKPEIILMDFSLGDGTGLDATKAILKDLPETQIVFLTMHEEDELLFDAIRCGAKGYLLKNLAVSKLVTSLRSLKKGEAPISRVMTARILDEFVQLENSGKRNYGAVDTLTEREKEVFRELARGASNKEIAERLFISENTVKNHVSSILEKLELKARRDVAAYAARVGM
jgi:DNA-binding NarL/FixJ family response regulator